MSAEPVQTAPAADALADLEAQAQFIEELQVTAVQAAQARQEMQAEAQAAAEVDSAAADLLAALEMARAAASGYLDWWDDFGRVWSDKALQGIATAGAAVMQRHGLTMGGLLSDPHVLLALAVVPPSFVTYSAIKAHQKGPRRERVQPSED